jgi:hypothetical protein
MSQSPLYQDLLTMQKMKKRSRDWWTRERESICDVWWLVVMGGGERVEEGVYKMRASMHLFYRRFSNAIETIQISSVSAKFMATE